MSLGSQGSFFLGSSGAAAGGGGYKIQRSLRFNDNDSSYLNKTFSSSGNRRTFTFSFWTKLGDPDAYKNIITASANPGASSSSSPRTEFRFGVDGKILFATNITGSSWRSATTIATFKDLSAWYHVVVAVDTTQSTEENRVKIYVNGVQELWSGSVAGQNDETPFNNTYGHAIGTYANNYNDFFDGYLAEFISIDGQALAPTDFGEFDLNSVWQPIEYAGTYGTNGFKLDFSDNSSDAALGTDTSGNGNDWTVNNLSVAAGAGNDSLVDTPEQRSGQTDSGVGGQVVGNYATWNPLFGENQSLSNGNLKAESSTTAYAIIASTLAMKSGKWYMEYTYTPNNGQPYITWGISQINRDGSQGSGVTDTPEDKGFKAWDSGFYSQSDGVNIHDYSSSVSSGDIISLAFDADAGKLWVAKNGTYMTNASGAGNPTAGTNPDYSGLTYSGGYYFMAGPYYTNGSTLEANFGQRSWSYSAPSGYKALCTANLPEPTIADGSTAFDTKLYTGNESTQAITGLNFSPDFAWLKRRSTSDDHRLFDTVRGNTKYLESNSTNADQTEAYMITSFNSDGFTLGFDDKTNKSGETYAAWTWSAGDSNTTIPVGGLNSSLYDQSQTWSSGTFFNANGNAFYNSGGSAAQLFDNVESGSGSTGDYPLPVDGGTFTLTFSQFSSASTVTLKLAGTGNALKINGSFVTINSASDSTQTFNVSGLTSIEWLYNGGSNYCYLGSIAVDGIKLIDSGVSVPNVPSIASTVRANPSAGFSIVSYLGNETSGQSFAHGLNASPELVIVKGRGTTEYWMVWSKAVAEQQSNDESVIFLNVSNAAQSGGANSNYFNGVDNSVVKVGSASNTNSSTSPGCIAYCFAPVSGYSAFGSYTGSSSLPFVFTGFKPKFIIVKRIDAAANWWMFDSERGTNELLYPNLSNAESDQGVLVFNFNSNGFKLGVTDGEVNASGGAYVYIAFASNPFKTARAS